VCQFGGDAIPGELTGEALYRHYPGLIVDLGRVLKGDGWQDRVEAVRADTDPKVYALAMLRKAMEGDLAAVTAMVREGINNLSHLGLEADSWLREGLMCEVLNIQPAPQPPLGWEGHYPEPIRTEADFIRWLDLLIHAKDALMPMTPLGREVRQGKSDGIALRNAYRLIDVLGLTNLPPQPTGQHAYHDEIAILRNLRRLCLARQGNVANGGGEDKSDPHEAPLLAAGVKTGQGEQDKGSKVTETEDPGDGGAKTQARREELVQQMEPAVRLAYLAFCYAESKAEKSLQDLEALNLLREDGIAEGAGERGELADYRLPAYATWARYLREARRLLGENKYTRRAGRPTGRSIVKGDQIEQQKGGDR
jgi:hypothetical protein